MSAYRKVKPGEWQRIAKAVKISCCDCGLVHIFEHRIVGRRVELRVFRDERATAAVRRQSKAYIQPKKGMVSEKQENQ